MNSIPRSAEHGRKGIAEGQPCSVTVLALRSLVESLTREARTLPFHGSYSEVHWEAGWKGEPKFLPAGRSTVQAACFLFS